MGASAIDLPLLQPGEGRSHACAAVEAGHLGCYVDEEHILFHQPQRAQRLQQLAAADHFEIRPQLLLELGHGISGITADSFQVLQPELHTHIRRACPDITSYLRSAAVPTPWRTWYLADRRCNDDKRDLLAGPPARDRLGPSQ